MSYERKTGVTRKQSEFVGKTKLSAQEFQPKDWYSKAYVTFREIWLDVPGIEDLVMVSQYGRVYHKTIGELSWGYPSGPGKYLKVQIQGKEHLTSRLVAMAFHPNPHKKPFVNHINGDIWCNMAWNVEWSTCSENTQHSYDVLNRTVLRGDDHKKIKLTDAQVTEMRALYNGGKHSKYEIARIYKSNPSTVSDILRGKRRIGKSHFTLASTKRYQK